MCPSFRAQESGLIAELLTYASWVVVGNEVGYIEVDLDGRCFIALLARPEIIYFTLGRLSQSESPVTSAREKIRVIAEIAIYRILFGPGVVKSGFISESTH